MPRGDRNRTDVSWFSVALSGRSNRVKLSADSTPVQCTGSPRRTCSSQTSVRTPRSARRAAMNSPPGPPPTIRTSTIGLSMSGDIISGLLRKAAVALFPGAGAGDPERQRDQLHIEPEASALHVHLIQPELAGARDVARRVHLGQSGQSGPDAVAHAVPGNRIELHQLPIAAHLHLAGPQRPWPDEAHVAGEDIPELRQFVHRRRPHDSADPGDSRIVLRRLHRSRARLGIGNHRPEFERVERPPTQTDARLPEQDRAAVFQLHRRGDQRPQRRRHQQAQSRQRTVERALHQAARAAAATRSNSSWYAATATLRSNCLATSRARPPMSRVIDGLSYIVAIASASAAGSPGAATRPQPLSRAICAGSLLGSVAAIYGRPAARMPYSLLGTMNPSMPALSDTRKASAVANESCSSAFGWYGRKRTFVMPRDAVIASRARRLDPSPTIATVSRSFDRSRSAASTRTSRFCDRPTFPECISTNRSASPCSRANGLSFGPGTIASQSAQLWITRRRAGSAPFSSTSRRRIRSPSATMPSACRSRYRLIRSSAVLTARF